MIKRRKLKIIATKNKRCKRKVGAIMREIEFRAWLKEEKKIVGVEEIDFIGQKSIAYDEIEYRYTDKEPFHYTRWVDFEDIELMQSSGLRDKTRTKEYPEGKKIFEGDIVKCKVYSLDNEHWEIDSIGQVMYDDDCCAYFIKFDESCIHLTSAWDLKVIGNIYENKELLENV